MTRKRTPQEWAFTLGVVVLVLWIQTPSAQRWWDGVKWKLRQKEELAKREAEIQKAVNHMQFEVWEIMNYGTPEETQ
jgi:hypothetical protein